MAQHHPRMAPAAVGQRELVQPVREGQPAKADVQIVGHGEVRQPQPTWRVFLREVDLTLVAMLGSPLAYAALHDKMRKSRSECSQPSASRGTSQEPKQTVSAPSPSEEQESS